MVQAQCSLATTIQVTLCMYTCTIHPPQKIIAFQLGVQYSNIESMLLNEQFELNGLITRQRLLNKRVDGLSTDTLPADVLPHQHTGVNSRVPVQLYNFWELHYIKARPLTMVSSGRGLYLLPAAYCLQEPCIKTFTRV